MLCSLSAEEGKLRKWRAPQLCPAPCRSCGCEAGLHWVSLGHLQVTFLISVPDDLGPEDASLIRVSYHLGFNSSMLNEADLLSRSIKQPKCSSMNITDVHYIA